MRQIGNLTITKDNRLDKASIEWMSGHLTIAAGVTFKATKLTEVRGWITIEDGATLLAPVLGNILGWLTLRKYANLDAPHLVSVTEVITLQEGAGYPLMPELHSAGLLALHHGATAELPKLTDLRALSLATDAVLNAVHLAHISQALTMRANAHLNAPELLLGSGFFDVDEKARLVAPLLKA
jgi:hypothetical protein